MWTKLSSKEILSHPRLTVIEDEVELPDGSHTTYLRYDKKGDGAAVICRNTEGKILLAKGYSYIPNEMMYEFPGGFVPNGEAIEEGANRELMEEVGLKAGSLTLLGSFLFDHRRSISRAYVYLAENLTEQKLPHDPEEHMEVYWFTPEQIDQIIAEGKVDQCVALAAWTIYKSKVKYS
jgi:ADP-ribose pyrophosphatase YjhB (NUDIX family)